MWVGGYFLGGWYLRYSMHVNVQKVCDNLTSWWAGCGWVKYSMHVNVQKVCVTFKNGVL